MKQASAAGESNKFGESGETYGAGELGEMEESVGNLTCPNHIRKVFFTLPGSE